jgi:ABC-type bacteriocin/lantibiotic exporter with double-glycine peptidase domain
MKHNGFDKVIGQKIPVILQNNSYECGIACLSMILNYQGYRVTLDDCRKYFKQDNNGVTAKTIIQTARHFGIKAKGYSVRSNAYLQYINMPVIIHWNTNHFVVLEKWTSDQASVIDPRLGRRQLTVDEFNGNFSGILLLFE